MKKLALESLTVDSFATAATPSGPGVGAEAVSLYGTRGCDATCDNSCRVCDTMEPTQDVNCSVFAC